MKNRITRSLGQALDELVRTMKWEKNFALQKLKADWPDVAGRNIAAHTEPSAIRDKKLFIRADSPIWSHQLNYMKQQVIDRINGYYDMKLVRDVFFAVKKRPA